MRGGLPLWCRYTPVRKVGIEQKARERGRVSLSAGLSRGQVQVLLRVRRTEERQKKTSFFSLCLKRRFLLLSPPFLEVLLRVFSCLTSLTTSRSPFFSLHLYPLPSKELTAAFRSRGFSSSSLRFLMGEEYLGISPCASSVLSYLCSERSGFAREPRRKRGRRRRGRGREGRQLCSALNS